MALRVGLAALASLMLAACATPSAWRQVSPPSVELAKTPFFPQADYQCGPAALATVLAVADPEIHADALIDEVYVPARQGSLQPELIAAVRRRAQVPVAVPRRLSALVAAVEAGSPVLVLQNLGIDALPVWHYAVVIGFDPDLPAVLLRSGTTERESLPPRRFLASWSRAAHWGFSVHPPSTPPPWAEVADWLQTVAVWSRQGRHALALTASAAAVSQWPASAAAQLAYGNALYAEGRREDAVAAFEAALARQATAGAYNNLAFVLAELGCVEQARARLAEGEARYPGFAAFAATARAVEAAVGVCPF